MRIRLLASLFQRTTDTVQPRFSAILMLLQRFHGIIMISFSSVSLWHDSLRNLNFWISDLVIIGMVLSKNTRFCIRKLSGLLDGPLVVSLDLRYRSLHIPRFLVPWSLLVTVIEFLVLIIRLGLWMWVVCFLVLVYMYKCQLHISQWLDIGTLLLWNWSWQPSVVTSLMHTTRPAFMPGSTLVASTEKWCLAR